MSRGSNSIGIVFVMCVDGRPIFEHVVGTPALSGEGPNAYPLVMHAALDMVDAERWQSGQMNLKRVDAFQGKNMYAYVTASNVVLLLMHDDGNEDNVSYLFREVHELYIKHMMNPFYNHGDTIRSPVFEQRVHKLMRSVQ